MEIFTPIRDLDEVALNVLRKRYFQPEEDWFKLVWRVCKTVVGDSEDFDTFFDMLFHRYFLPNSPCLVNAGLKNNGLSACFVVDFPDTIEGIYQTKLDFALIARKGGGCGTTLSKLRPEGSTVAGSTHGYAGGPIKFADTISHDMDALTQAGFREMAIMFTMSVYHPDIIKFITAKEIEGKIANANISVIVDNAFMEKVKNNETYTTFFDYDTGREYYRELNAREVFNLIIEGAWKNGEPGILFREKIDNSPYKYTDQVIDATNPCFHPDTIVETTEGRIKIKDITRPMNVYTVDSSGNLTTRRCTPSWVSKHNAETLIITLSNGKTLTVTPEHKILTKNRGWVEAKDLAEHEELVGLCRSRRGTKYSGIKLTTEPNRSYRMEHRFVFNQHYGFIPGDFDVHHRDGDTYNNSFTNLEVLSHSDHAKLSAYTQPNNHQVQDSLGRFVSSSKSKHGKKLSIKMPDELRSDFNTSPFVRSITTGPVTDVYDISVEETNSLIANFIVAHNCGEQPLPPNGACNLGSADISKCLRYNEDTQSYILDLWLLEVVTRLGVRFLDSVIDVSSYPTEAINKWVKENRPIGFGIMGLADYYLLKKLPYGSPKALEELEFILNFIYKIAEDESISLGEEKGIPLECQKLPVPRRNITLLTVAPTGTISILAGCSSGIEPVFSEITIRQDKTGTYHITHPLADKSYFRCAVSANGAEEVTWKEHILTQDMASKYVDSGVSKTINFPNKTHRDTIYDAYMYAWECDYIKGMTVYRNGSRKQEVLSPKNLKKDKCPVCGADLIHEDGCKHCSVCDYSLCEIG